MLYKAKVLKEEEVRMIWEPSNSKEYTDSYSVLRKADNNFFFP